ncbi:MAG: YggT family protein [Clostridia bacterium]|nr:YggT family protein [Clostridia bacterium]
MGIVLQVLSNTVILMIGAIQLCMFITAILSFLSPPTGDVGPIRGFLMTVSDYVTYPVRCLLDRFEWARRTPIDLSFLITYLLLSLISTILSFL